MGASTAEMDIPCPLCGGRRHRPFTQADHRRIAACADCGHLFAARFSTDELRRLYAERYYASKDDPRIDGWIQSNRRVWLGLCQAVTRHIAQPRSLLDVGAGTGGFLLAFHEHCPSTSLAAIESSPQARDAIRQKMPQVDFPADDAEGLDHVTSRYQVVTLLQTLEHVSDPRRLLRAVHDRLEEGGLLLLTVPNRWSYRSMIKGMRDDFNFANPTHLHFFSAGVLRRLLSESGFGGVRRLRGMGGSNVTGLRQLPQWLLRLAGLSTELRYVAWRGQGDKQRSLPCSEPPSVKLL